jgi:hypothetical protein
MLLLSAPTSPKLISLSSPSSVPTLGQREAVDALHACMSALEAHLKPLPGHPPPKILLMDEYWSSMVAAGPRRGPSQLALLLESVGSRRGCKTRSHRMDLVASGSSLSVQTLWQDVQECGAGWAQISHFSGRAELVDESADGLLISLTNPFNVSGLLLALEGLYPELQFDAREAASP